MVKKSACNAGDVGSIPGLGKSSGGRNGNPLQYSCWRIPWTEGPARYSPWGLTESDMTIGIRTKGAGGGEGVLHAAHLLVHLLTEQVCAECQQSANHCLRGWTTNMPEMGLLGSGRENRPKTRSSQTSELAQGRVWGGSSALCLFIPKRQSHWPCLSHRWAGAWTEWRPPRDACTS